MHQKSNLELKELEYKASELRIALDGGPTGLSRTNNGTTLIRENPVAQKNVHILPSFDTVSSKSVAITKRYCERSEALPRSGVPGRSPAKAGPLATTTLIGRSL